LAVLDLPTDPERIEKWTSAYDHLTPYPDVLPALNALGRRRLAVFSNGCPEMIRRLVGNASITQAFETLISVDAAHTFKPSQKAYQLACDRLALRPKQILLVSSNGFDLQGGGRFGLRAALIERFTGADLRARLNREPIGATSMFLALRS
jgi:2-haloacid dehalogenase